MNIKRNQGFTLIELMIIVVVTGFLASAGINSYRSTRQRVDLGKQSRALYSTLQNARAGAVALGIPVTCRLLVNGVVCFQWTDAASPGVIDWADDNGNGLYDVGEGEVTQVIEQFRFDAAQPINVASTTYISTGATDFVIQNDGTFLTVAGEPAASLYTLTSSGDNTFYRIQFYSTGLITLV